MCFSHANTIGIVTGPLLNIKQNVSPLRLEICRQFDARYTPHCLPNTAHISWLVLLYHLCSSTCQASLHFYKLWLKYSDECISVSIAHMATKRCPLHHTSDVMCTAHLLVCTMSTPVSGKPSEIAALHIHD